MGDHMYTFPPKHRKELSMKKAKRILAVVIVVAILISVKVSSASASVDAAVHTPYSQNTSTLSNDYLGPVTSKDVIY